MSWDSATVVLPPLRRRRIVGGRFRICIGAFMSKPIQSLRLAVPLVALLSAFSALAAPVRGRITLHEKLVPRAYEEAAKPDARRYTWREPSPTVRAEFRVLSANISRDICIAAFGTSTSAAA